MLKKLALFVLFIFNFMQSVWANSIELTDDFKKINILKGLEYNISLEDISAAPPIEGWSQFSQPIKLGFDQRVHWFRFTLRNNSTFAQSPYLEFDAPLMDNLVVYILNKGKINSVQHLGDEQAFHLRPVISESYVVPLKLEPFEELEFYIAMQTAGAVQVPITLWQKEIYQQVKSFDNLKIGLFSGLIVAFLLVSFISFTISKDVHYLLNAGLVFSLFMITLIMSGYAFHYLWPGIPAIQQHAFYLFSCLAILFSGLSARDTLGVFYPNPNLIKTFNAISILSLVILPITLFVSYQTGLYLITGLAIIICLAHLSGGFISWKHGLHEHQEINYGLGLLLLTLCYIVVNNFTQVPLPFSNLTLLSFTVVTQVIIILISIIRNNSVAFSTISDADSELDSDSLLSDKMMELQFALRELEEKNQQLEKLNTLDALSGIHNRRYFDKKILSELRRARRELSPISLIMFDIDHFKKVNDTYGHLAGDEVIRTVALTASEQLNRPSDAIFRYGGEEFAVLLPNTEAHGAVKIAELIREKIAELIISSNQTEIRCTISLGVSFHNSQTAITPENMIGNADAALYQAKQDGRNNTKLYNQEETVSGTT